MENPVKRHKHATEPRPEHGLAYHPNRGVSVQAHLKSGWRWLTDAEAKAHARGEQMPVTKVVKPRVRPRPLGRRAW